MHHRSAEAAASVGCGGGGRHLVEQVEREPVFLHLGHNLSLGGWPRLDSRDVRHAVRQQLQQFCGFIRFTRGRDDGYGEDGGQQHGDAGSNGTPHITRMLPNIIRRWVAQKMSSWCVLGLAAAAARLARGAAYNQRFGCASRRRGGGQRATLGGNCAIRCRWIRGGGEADAVPGATVQTERKCGRAAKGGDENLGGGVVDLPCDGVMMTPPRPSSGCPIPFGNPAPSLFNKRHKNSHL